MLNILVSAIYSSILVSFFLIILILIFFIKIKKFELTHDIKKTFNDRVKIKPIDVLLIFVPILNLILLFMMYKVCNFKEEEMINYYNKI